MTGRSLGSHDVIRSRPKIEDWQREASSRSIEWTGDLSDDCTAVWAGLVLRAEMMKRGSWWWAVYDDRTKEVLRSSNTSETRVSNGKKARAAAESAARDWLGAAQPAVAADGGVGRSAPSPRRS
jgi:hypothetical protein